ncbi:hypothetical protein [Paenibacillus tianjinensis]|uniref:Uncharacterized protein n=1 Tax=Paenibacillus tianjinensis TaxID=2810347 RepID=A0ABX7L828_9BACL|nr:hypothetical protein [Paenibacillus tianjinensis]QSF43533.1 hypothetical protein JRJ22_19930 [Paenibacillus tianjinensis]
MARPAGNKNADANAEVPQIQGDTKVDSTQEENKQLKREINDLKAMFQQLMSTVQSQNEAKVVTPIIEEEDEYSTIDIQPNQLIKVTSLFYGGMVLRGSNNKRIPFEKFGVTLPVSYEDLNYICSNHRKLAEEGCFYIHDKNVIKALYLEDNYKNIVNKQTIESIITLSDQQITDIITNLTPALRFTVEDIVIQGIISNDRRYGDRNKIDLISRLCDKNLSKIAQERIDNN